MNQELIEYLFKTNAIRVCPKDEPFWYTSGKIGPYYVNTHFLYGSEDKANTLLKEIDRIKDNKLLCSKEIHRLTKENYLSDELFKGTIDALEEYILDNIRIDQIDYVSGGERRDWFFSFLIAELLEKPHITLFKDLSSVIYENGESRKAECLYGAKILHVADLITTASSYERAWLPALSKLSGVMKWSLVVVDRLQGGEEALSNLNVDSHSLVAIDTYVFEKAHECGYIDDAQLKLVLDYMDDSEGSMKAFIKEHPEFIINAIQQGGKIAERANFMIRSNFYDIKSFM